MYSSVTISSANLNQLGARPPSAMSARSHETRSTTPDRADDDKTIREDLIVMDLPQEKKDADDREKTSRSRSGSESVRVSEKQPVPSYDDDFPDGGFRAWLVVAGVSICMVYGSPQSLTSYYSLHLAHSPLSDSSTPGECVKASYLLGTNLMPFAGVPSLLRTDLTEHHVAINNVCY